jgi:hypothetical protein
MRTFTVDGRVFTGFDRKFTDPHKLVLVQDEDTITAYAIDVDVHDINLTSRCIDELLRYFDFVGSQECIIGTYEERHFLGFTVVEPDRISKISRKAY